MTTPEHVSGTGLTRPKESADEASVALGFGLGFVGVVAFSLTLPMTRLAVPALGGAFVGLGRAEVAALLALVVLLARRERVPARRHWAGLATVALGVVLGFPLLTSLALEHVPSVHGAVIVGLLPAATAVMAVVRGGERPGVGFWLACGAGVVAVLLFAAAQGAGRPQPADGLLLGAVLLGALGYAEGGRLSRELGGWRVICWALVLAAPLLVVPALLAATRVDWGDVGAGAWFGFAYVAAVSAFLGFFAWYQGLALGGIARVGQIQLVQPVLTLLWAALFLSEAVSLGTASAAALVVASAALSRWTRVQRPVEPT